MHYGHPTESSAMGIIQFANGIRTEVHHGKPLLMPWRWYQSYEIIGSKGRMLRLNDTMHTFQIRNDPSRRLPRSGYQPAGRRERNLRPNHA